MGYSCLGGKVDRNQDGAHRNLKHGSQQDIKPLFEAQNVSRVRKQSKNKRKTSRQRNYCYVKRHILWLVLPGRKVLNCACKDGHELGTFVEEGQADQKHRSPVVEAPDVVEKLEKSFLFSFGLLDIFAVLLLDLLFKFLNRKGLPAKCRPIFLS